MTSSTLASDAESSDLVNTPSRVERKARSVLMFSRLLSHRQRDSTATRYDPSTARPSARKWLRHQLSTRVDAAVKFLASSPTLATVTLASGEALPRTTYDAWKTGVNSVERFTALSTYARRITRPGVCSRTGMRSTASGSR